MPTQVALPVPFPLKTANAWLFPGAAPAIVDCGLGGTQAELHAAMRAAGVPDNVDLYLTHGHVDHAGNAKWLRDRGARVLAPKVEEPFVTTYRRDSNDRNDAYGAALLAHGMPSETVEDMRTRSHLVESFLEDTPLDGHPMNGQKIVLGDQEATILHTPGHTPGSTCFLLEDALVSGDTLLETITSNAVELADFDKGRFHQYLKSIESLRRYGGLECLPGHRDPFVISDALIDQHLEWHDARRRKIQAALTTPRTAYELLPRIFPGLGGDARFMAMAELVGHLNAMEIDERVAYTELDGIRRYRA